MSLYTETGAINVVSNDTTKGRYSPTGALRINLVSGTAYTGLYAADGALNVVDVSGVSANTYGGLYHPCGAIRARTALDTFTGLYAPDGSYYFNGLFSPLNLFANGEQGVWYDPSDMTTLFQDAAGTTPVTAVEQPVGLMLDKSKGLVLGSELVTNGGFDADSGWGKGTGWTISGGTANASAATSSNLTSISTPLVIGRWYEFTYTISNYVGGSVNIGNFGADGIPRSANGTYTQYIRAAETTVRIRATSPFTGSIDNISVRELPGNHASQSTSASRPVLSARVNLLTHTEAFDNAAWTKTNSTVTANAATAPDGTTTADALFTTAATSIFVIGQNHTIGTASTALLYAKANTTGFLQLSFNGDTTSYANFNLSTGALGNSTGTVTAFIESVGSGWYKCSVQNTSAAVTGITWGIIGSSTATRRQTFTATGAESIYIWGADLRPANAGVNLPAYQRVGAATYGVTNPSVVIGNPDYDTNGFPMYLKFDGTDDSMATGTINPGSVDKVQVFAGVRKLSDAAAGIVAETSTSASVAGNPGAIYIFAQSSASYAFLSKGTNFGGYVTSPASFAAPITKVLTGLGDISGDRATLRVNGTQVAQSTGDQGTGNFLSYPLYIGRRGGTTFPFNGHLYSLVVRFSATNLPDATIAQTETWVNGKTGAY